MSTVAFRCDADARIGSGHAMRCLALAEALAMKGAQTVLLCQALPAQIEARARRIGAAVRTLPPHPPAQVAATRAALATIPDLAWLVVDHYEVDAAWEEEVLEGTGARLAVVDDHATRRHACALLVDHNLSADAKQYEDRVPPTALRLIGPRYALLRPAFAGGAPPGGGRAALRRLHVGFGGADPTGETEKVLQALLHARMGELAVDVVVGPANPRLEGIRALAARLPGVEVHVDPEDMAALLRRADLAIGAAGVSALERCACGVPSLLITVAENQLPIAAALVEQGAARLLGASNVVEPAQIARSLAALAASPGSRQAMARRAAALCDGQGARRVAARLLAPPLALRPAVAQDSDAILAWRNHETTRRFSHDPAPIAPEAHARWFEKRLADASGALLVAEDASGAAGVLRYDAEGDSVTVSVYLVPGRHGQGIGGSLLQAGHAWLRTHRPRVRMVNAEVRAENVASRHAFEEAGYRQQDALRFTRPL